MLAQALPETPALSCNQAMQFISPQNDFAFKRIFGSEQHKEVLISFLNSVLDLNDERQIVTVQLADPYQVPRLKQFKETILDIKATCKSGRQFIVEMQVEHQHYFYKRALYYSSKAYTEQLSSGAGFSELKPVYFIGVLNFSAMQSSRYLSRHLILDAETHEQHMSDFEFCFIELPKFAKSESELDSVVDKWIFFLKYLGTKGGENKDFASLFANEPPLLKALEIARYHSLDPDELYAYEARERRRMIEAETMNTAVNKAHSKGKEEGREEGLKIAAKVLAKNGHRADAIARELQIDVDKVQKLLRE